MIRNKPAAELIHDARVCPLGAASMECGDSAPLWVPSWRQAARLSARLILGAPAPSRLNAKGVDKGGRQGAGAPRGNASAKQSPLWFSSWQRAASFPGTKGDYVWGGVPELLLSGPGIERQPVPAEPHSQGSLEDSATLG